MMNEREEESGAGTGTKERDVYRALLRDTILLLQEEKRAALPLFKHRLKAATPSFVPVPDPSSPPPITHHSSLITSSSPPTVKLTQKSAPSSFVPVPDPSSSPPITHHSSLIASSPSPTPRSFNLSSLFPEMHHIDTPPDDSRAKENATRWKKWKMSASVILLSFGEKDEELAYLKNLAKAIHTRLKPTKILDGHAFEKEKRWETLFRVNVFELILVTKKSLEKTEFLKSLVEEPSFSVKTPLLLLTDEMMQEKALLWKKICQLIAK